MCLSILKEEGIDHVRSAPFHPMTQGKIERYHRSMKNGLLLEHYYSPDELSQRLTEWVAYYNYQCYHESLDNVRPTDAYWGRQEQILAERKNFATNFVPKADKRPTAVVIFFSTSKVAKTISSLFTRSCPLSADDVQRYRFFQTGYVFMTVLCTIQ